MLGLKLLLAFFLGVGLSISYFTSSNLLGQQAKRNSDLIKSKLTVLSDDDLRFLFDENVIKIDARDHSLYEARRVKGSINITVHDIMTDPARERRKLKDALGKKIYVYCSGSSCDSSMEVAKYLSFADFDVYVYRPGWPSIKLVAETEW